MVLSGVAPRSLGVLVTGGSGFIGRAAVEQLARRGHRVWATSTSSQPLANTGDLRWIRWDATRDSLPPVDFDKLDCVVHLASPRGDAPADQFEVAVAATLRLLEAARDAGTPRFLYGSTGDVLAPGNPPAREDDHWFRPDSFYGAARASGELLLRASGSRPPGVAILRFFHPYGPGGERFLINRVFDRVRQGEPVHVQGAEGFSLNPVWIDDLAEGIVRAVESEATGTFHFGGPETMTFLELVRMMGEVSGKAVVIESRPGQPVERHAGAWERSADVLGFNPRVAVRAGLEMLAPRSAAAGSRG